MLWLEQWGFVECRESNLIVNREWNEMDGICKIEFSVLNSNSDGKALSVYVCGRRIWMSWRTKWNECGFLSTVGNDRIQSIWKTRRLASQFVWFVIKNRNSFSLFSYADLLSLHLIVDVWIEHWNIVENLYICVCMYVSNRWTLVGLM